MAGFRRDFRDRGRDHGPLINRRILRFPEVRLVGSDGSQLGVVSSREALNRAEDEGLDLVVVAQNAQPPVCRIVDYGKFKYEQEKQKKDQKRKTQEVKGIKISPRIAEHDIGHLLKNALRFLEEGHKVKITCQFRAREVAHPELGKRKLDAMAEKLSEVGVVERQPTLDGKLMIMVMSPKPHSKPQAGKKKDAKAEDKQDSGKEVQDNRVGKNNPPESVQQPPVSSQVELEKATPGEGTDPV